MAPKAKPPGRGDGGFRVEKASDKPRRKAGPEPEWLPPREPLPPAVTNAVRRSIIDKARDVLGIEATAEIDDHPLLAAVLVAQALDRLSESIIEAAAVSRYRGP